MKKKNFKISVAGIRGIYPDEITPEIAFKFAFAFGFFGKGKTFLVGKDTRISGDVLISSVISGLLSSGKNVLNIEITPTPMIGFIIEKIENKYGIMVTASHNPEEYNGLKFFNKKGNFINNDEWKKFLEIIKSVKKLKLSSIPGEIKKIEKNYIKIYFDNIYKLVDVKKIREKKFKVIVDACQGVSSIYTEEFLKNLGCDVLVFNKFPYGKFSHNPEPLIENLQQLKEKVIKEKGDIGFIQDPDCDRFSFVCENADIPGEETTLAICLDSVLEKEKTPVVVNLSTTSLIDDICKKHKVKIYRTKIGEINVVEKMRKIKSRAGGEGNGGVIWGKFHYGRDSYIGISLLLEKMAEENKKISEIVNNYPKYYMIKEKYKIKNIKFILKKIKKIYKNEKLDLTDGIKIIRENGWIHIRQSGTEPVVRVIVEATTKITADEYLKEIYSILSARPGMPDQVWRST
ncbi:MAG TPA: phosphoglucosamine mutase [bacterium]|nr:phosphoglucosamine mutase [bacterium]